MTFDMQWRHVIGIPRDLSLKTAEKVQPFSFFSSNTFSDGLPLIHGLPFRNSKKYDMSLCLSHMMVDRSSLCYFWGSDFFFLQRNNFGCQIQNTKPRYMRVFAVMLLFWKKTKM